MGVLSGKGMAVGAVDLSGACAVVCCTLYVLDAAIAGSFRALGRLDEIRRSLGIHLSSSLHRIGFFVASTSACPASRSYCGGCCRV